MSDLDVPLPDRDSHRADSARAVVNLADRNTLPNKCQQEAVAELDGHPVVGLVAALWRLHSATGSKFIPKAAAVAGCERREGSLGGTEGDHKVSEL